MRFHPPSSTFAGPLLFVLTLSISCSDQQVASTKQASLPAPLGQAATVPIGATRGQFEVTPDGAAHYRVELDVPPGRRGIEPRLAIDYLSNRGDGPLGVGFALSGLSSIHRCGRTYAQDDELQPVNLEPSDRLCLDGVRLLAISGAYGADGTQYRPELDNFSRITGHVIDGVAVGFTVENGDTTRSLYGAREVCGPAGGSSDCSAVVVARGGVPRRWSLRRTSDRYENYLEVTYERRRSAFDDAGDDASDETVEQLPIQIDYTGHASSGKKPQRKIELFYEARPDQSLGYYRGSRIERTRRLVEIWTHAPELGPVKSYRLEYENDEASGRSILSQLVECGRDNVCLPPTQLSWDAPEGALGAPISSGFEVPSWWPSASIAIKRYQPPLAVDINADGSDDLIYAKRVGTNQNDVRWHTAVSTPGGSLAFAPEVASSYLAYFAPDDNGFPELGGPARIVAADVNDDGRYDILAPFAGIANLSGVNAEGLPSISVGTPIVTGDPDLFKPKNARVADVNGDGLADYLYCNPSYLEDPSGATSAWRVHLHQGAGYAPPIDLALLDDNCSDDRLLLIDTDGDGSTEILVADYDNDNYQAIHLAGPTPVIVDSGLPNWGGQESAARQILDVNGDGLRDVLMARNPVCAPDCQTRYVSLWLNSGRGFIGGRDGLRGLPGDVGQFAPHALKEARIVDYNRDGRQDLLLPEPNNVANPNGGGQWRIYLATGVSHEQAGGGSFPFAVGPSLLSFSSFYDNGPPLSGEDQHPLFADFNGDTLPDLFYIDLDLKGRVRLHQGSKLAVTDIREGSVGADPSTKEWDERFTFRVVYGGLQQGLYEPGLPYKWPLERCKYPVTCRPARAVVAAEHLVASPGGVRRFRHRYHDARFDRMGRGWLGYGAHVETEDDLGTTTFTVSDNFSVILEAGRRRIYPYQGLPLRVLTLVADGPKEHYRDVWIHYDHHIEDGRLLAYAARTTTSRGEGDTLTYYRSRTLDEVDAFGNVIRERRQWGTSGDRTDTIVTAYKNDLSSWLIGLPTERTTTSNVEGYEKERTIAWEYAETTGALERTIVEPDDGTQRVVHESKARDGFGNVVESVTTSAEGEQRSQTATFDEHGVFPTRLQNALGHATELTAYPGTGEPWVELEPNGLVTRWQRDGLGRLTRILSPANQDTSITRRRVGDALFHAEIDESTSGGPSSTLVFDWNAVPTRSIETHLDSQRSYTDVEFDVRGKLTSATPPAWEGTSAAGVHRWSYDRLGRVIEHIGPDGATTSFDHQGLTTVVTDSLGHESRYERNQLGLLDRVVDANGGDTRFTYHGFGIPYEIAADLQNASTGSNMWIRQITDDYGRLRFLHDPDTGFQQYEHDSLGQLTRHVAPNGSESTYEYDALGRMTKQTDIDGTTSFEWDNQFASNPYSRVGRLRATLSPDGVSTEYSYSPAGDPTYVATAIPNEGLFWRRIDYDSHGRPITHRINWPDGTDRGEFVIRHKYSDSGQLIAVDSDTFGNHWSLAKVRPSGLFEREVFGNGVESESTYSTADRLTRRLIGFKGSSLADLRFRYDAKGNLRERTDALFDRWQQFEHDSLDRLTSTVDCDGARRRPCEAGLTLDYDDVGNIVHKSDVGDYHYSAGQPHAAILAGGAPLSYDDAGNQTTGPTASVTYNALNRAATVTQPGAATTLSYDAFGARVRKVRSTKAQTTKTVSLDRIFEQVSASGDVEQRIYIPAAGRSIAVATLKRGQRPRIRYIHHDHLGSPALLTDDKAKVAARIFFDPFGEPRKESWFGEAQKLADLGITEGFTGHAHDEELQSINMVGRDYDPRLGRFHTADPIISAPGLSQSLNRFSYVWNNPLRLVDPSGFVGEESSYETVVTGESRPEIASTPGPATYGGYELEFVQTGPMETTVYMHPLEDGGSESDTDFGWLVGTASGTAIGLIPVVGALKEYDDSMEGMFDDIIDGDYVSAAGNGILTVAAGVTAVVEGVTLGTATVGTKAARGGLRAAVKGAVKWAKSRGRSAVKKPKKSVPKKGCFVAGTIVPTLSGSKPIEEIEVGDHVLSRDPETGEMAYRQVVWLKPPESMEVVALEFVDDSGNGETITATPDHPFWVRGRGWVEAAQIEIGEEVFSAPGSWLRLSSGTWAIDERVVYNFEVEGWNTYFVGELGAWVHNTTCGKKIANDDLLAPPSKRGKAPIGSDGHPVELHHRGQKPDSPLDEMTRTDHRLGGNFEKNHANTGKKKSLIDRAKFNRERKKYWKDEWDGGRFDGM